MVAAFEGEAVESFLRAHRRRLTQRLVAAALALGASLGVFVLVATIGWRGMPAALAIVITAPLCVALAVRLVLGRVLRSRWTRLGRRIYRVREPATACGICARAGDSTAMCARCDRPVCIEHVPMSDARCVSCEHAFESRVARRYAGFVAAAFGALPFGLYLALVPTIARFPVGAGGMRGFSTGVPLLDAAAMALFFSVVFARGFRTARRALMRWRFLGEHAADMKTEPALVRVFD